MSSLLLLQSPSLQRPSPSTATTTTTSLDLRLQRQTTVRLSLLVAQTGANCAPLQAMVSSTTTWMAISLTWTRWRWSHRRRRRLLLRRRRLHLRDLQPRRAGARAEQEASRRRRRWRSKYATDCESQRGTALTPRSHSQKAKDTKTSNEQVFSFLADPRDVRIGLRWGFDEWKLILALRRPMAFDRARKATILALSRSPSRRGSRSPHSRLSSGRSNRTTTTLCSSSRRASSSSWWVPSILSPANFC